MLYRGNHGGASIAASDIDDALAKPIIFDGPQTGNPDGTRNPQMVAICAGPTWKPCIGRCDSFTSGRFPEQIQQKLSTTSIRRCYPCSRTIPMGAGLVIAAQNKGTRRTLTLHPGISALKAGHLAGIHDPSRHVSLGAMGNDPPTYKPNQRFAGMDPGQHEDTRIARKHLCARHSV